MRRTIYFLLIPLLVTIAVLFLVKSRVDLNNYLPGTDQKYVNAMGKWGVVRLIGMQIELPLEVEVPGSSHDKFVNIFIKSPTINTKQGDLISKIEIASGCFSAAKNIQDSTPGPIFIQKIDPNKLEGCLYVYQYVIPKRLEGYSISNFLDEMNLVSGEGGKVVCERNGGTFSAGFREKYIFNNSSVEGYRYLEDRCFPKDGASGSDIEYVVKVNKNIYSFFTQDYPAESIFNKIISSISPVQ